MHKTPFTLPVRGLQAEFVRVGMVPDPLEFLSRGELEQYDALRVPKRRDEWLAGRYAAKKLLISRWLKGAPMQSVEVYADAEGRPVCMHGGAEYALSITHSGDFAAAASAGKGSRFIGVDLERVEPRDPAWQGDFFRPHEAEPGLPKDEAFTRAWALKEALLKALGLGLRAPALDVHLVRGSRPVFSGMAKKRYEEMGCPDFACGVITQNGYAFAAAAPAPHGRWKWLKDKIFR